MATSARKPDDDQALLIYESLPVSSAFRQFRAPTTLEFHTTQQPSSTHRITSPEVSRCQATRDPTTCQARPPPEFSHPGSVRPLSSSQRMSSAADRLTSPKAVIPASPLELSRQLLPTPTPGMSVTLEVPVAPRAVVEVGVGPGKAGLEEVVVGAGADRAGRSEIFGTFPLFQMRISLFPCRCQIEWSCKVAVFRL